MIKSVALENFQSHRSTLVEFCPGLNVICGASDAGKTAILRAIQWVAKNRPSGDDVRSWGCSKKDPVRVEVVLDNSGSEVTVLKERLGSSVSYESSEFGKLDVVGKDLPPEVQQVFNLSGFNIQLQHDAYFLVGESSGNVARTINDLVGLSVIDVIFKNINSRATRADNQASILRKQADGIAAGICELGYLEQAEADLVAAEEEEAGLGQAMLRVGNLRSLSLAIRDSEENIAVARKLAQAGDELSMLKREIARMENLQSRKCSLATLAATLNESARVIREENEWLSIEKPLNDIRASIDSLDEEKARLERLEKAVSGIRNSELTASRERTRLERLRDRLARALRESGACPTCLREYDEETIRRMVK